MKQEGEMEDVNSNRINMFDKMFTKFESDEMKASVSLRWMPTFYHSDTEEFDSYDGLDYVVVLPGMEGHGGVVERVCRRLKLRALLCQFITNTSPHTVQQLATHLIQELVQKIGIGMKFNILAYEFGTLLALEMAKLFEQMGIAGNLIFVKETPLQYLKSSQSLFLSTSEDRLQSALLMRLASLIQGGGGVTSLIQGDDGVCDELEMMLDFEHGWARKVDTCIRYLRSRCTYSTGYLRDVLNSSWLRIELTKFYRIEYTLHKTRYILIKPELHHTGDDDQLLGDKLTVYLVGDYLGDLDEYEVAHFVNKVTVRDCDLDLQLM